MEKMKLLDHHHQYCCRSLWPNHNSMRLLSCFCFYIITFTVVVVNNDINVCIADSSGPFQDMWPTSPPAEQQKNNVLAMDRPCVLMPGYSAAVTRVTNDCRKLSVYPALVTASDFKSSELNHVGNTDNFLQSLVTLVTAAEYPGINTQGQSRARTDLTVGRLVLPHSHPCASGMLHGYSGIVIAGFIESRGKLFQNYRRAGDTVVFPGGLLHFSLNGGFELATAFSVLNTQNPGLVMVADAMFSPEDHVAVEDTHVNHAFSFSWEWNDGTLLVAVGN